MAFLNLVNLGQSRFRGHFRGVWSVKSVFRAAGRCNVASLVCAQVLFVLVAESIWNTMSWPFWGCIAEQSRLFDIHAVLFLWVQDSPLLLDICTWTKIATKQFSSVYSCFLLWWTRSCFCVLASFWLTFRPGELAAKECLSEKIGQEPFKFALAENTRVVTSRTMANLIISRRSQSIKSNRTEHTATCTVLVIP